MVDAAMYLRRFEDTEMKTTRLIQRLLRPFNPPAEWAIKDNPFSFGGGLVNGGISEAGMNLIRSVFSFDYMGAAEFEWGSVPAALNYVATHHSQYSSSFFEVDLDDVADPYTLMRRRGHLPEARGEAAVYILCESRFQDQVHERVRSWLNGQEDRLKEPTHLAGALKPLREGRSTPVGWLELNNGFFFFVDAEMYERTAQLFQIPI